MENDLRFELSALDFVIEKLDVVSKGVSSLERSVQGSCHERNRKIENFLYTKFTTQTL